MADAPADDLAPGVLAACAAAEDGCFLTLSANSPGSAERKVQAELDKELELKMQGLAGDGGESGIEYEDGRPVSMKRSVKNNMFRYI